MSTLHGVPLCEETKLSYSAADEYLGSLELQRLDTFLCKSFGEPSVQLSWGHDWSGAAGSQSAVRLWQRLPQSCPKHVHKFTLPPEVHTGSFRSRSLPTLGIFCYSRFRHSDGCAVPCWFELAFL